MVTDEIITALKTGELDMGLLATPLQEKSSLNTIYSMKNCLFMLHMCVSKSNKELMVAEEIDFRIYCLLVEEGHCLRNQVLNLCESKRREQKHITLHYESGQALKI